MIGIRPATVEDADSLAPMLAEAIRATYSAIAPPELYEAVIGHTCTPAAVASVIEAANNGRGHFLVAEPVPLGFIDVGEDEDGYERRRLYTSVGETGRGVGAELLKALENLLAAGTEYRAIVHAGNRRALAFWTRHGFDVVGPVDTRAHFGAHRGVVFDESQMPDTSLLLRRVVACVTH